MSSKASQGTKITVQSNNSTIGTNNVIIDAYKKNADDNNNTNSSSSSDYTMHRTTNVMSISQEIFPQYPDDSDDELLLTSNELANDNTSIVYRTPKHKKVRPDNNAIGDGYDSNGPYSDAYESDYNTTDPSAITSSTKRVRSRKGELQNLGGNQEKKEEIIKYWPSDGSKQRSSGCTFIPLSEFIGFGIDNKLLSPDHPETKTFNYYFLELLCLNKANLY